MELVDLVTDSKIVEDIMITEYPSELYPAQCEKIEDVDSDGVNFCFTGFPRNQVLKFLKRKRGELKRESYIVKNHNTGESILLSDRGRMIKGPKAISAYLAKRIHSYHANAEQQIIIRTNSIYN